MSELADVAKEPEAHCRGGVDFFETVTAASTGLAGTATPTPAARRLAWGLGVELLEVKY
jgi:hypothetical protein